MRTGLVLLFTINAFCVLAQQGGKSVFQSLSLAPSAKIAALGGEQIVTIEKDVSFAMVNPANLHPELHNTVALNYVSYFSDIKYSNLGYARNVNGFGTVSASLNYLNYGNFTRTDAAGNQIGEFSATDFYVQVGASKLLDSLIYLGVNAKYLQSNLDDLRANGMAFDVGATYYSKNTLFATSLLIKNAGFQFNGYTNQKQKLPFEVQFGLTKKLAHAPFRFSLLLNNLQTADLSYQNSNLIKVDPITDEVTLPSTNLAEKIMQHTVFGVEFLPVKAFNVRMGYNYRRRNDLKIEDRTAMVGFSWGFGIKIASFKIDYGRATYHLAGASNFISISKSISN